jgi:hypoxanthine phosphoribosyltransferase
MTERVQLEFKTISQALRSFEFPDVEVIIGIATGGIVPASLIAHQLSCPLGLLRINYRAQDNSVARPTPELLGDPNLPSISKRILLVDDVSVTGTTLSFALGLLEDHKVMTFVLKGNADYVLFPKISQCVDWPWRA